MVNPGADMTTTIERPMLVSLAALLLFMLLESIMYTIVDPSLIFYIKSVGGTNDDYGLTTSAVSLGMTIMVLFFGKWIDCNGNKYQAPLACAFIIGIIGSIIYFAASLMVPGFWAAKAVLVGRLVQGLGIGGKTLVNSWIATAIPLEKQKTIFTILAIVGIAGRAIGPLFNILVAEIDTTIAITSTFSVNLNPLNSVGLLVACNEVLLWLIVAIFVKDPPPREKVLTSVNPEEPSTGPPPEAGLYDILKSLTNFKIWFTFMQMFVFSANYCLYTVAIAPVSANMLNWTPVEISKLFAFESLITFIGMGVTLYLSVMKVSDFAMLAMGHGVFAVSGAFAYFGWREDTASVFTFVFPLVFFYFVYPFAGPAIQTSFNEAVFSIPEIAGSIGVFQSLLSQSSTLATIVVPPLVMSYVVKDSNDISRRSHELSPWALYVPISSLLMIFGLLYDKFVLEKRLSTGEPEEMADEEMIPNETSKLVKKEHKIGDDLLLN
mmetsp:Transcript_27690/g.39633  ORF Transcript_27690/g.39633 Transcript_27690/m.39633 type:complete len:492 (-) Transcript_27690:102-1577(-)|eukprot:CAMPEP_0201693484 /NCGR_PEP_ID=MMETSP0578-20130828/6070_1 /ASSEMBLY_ACC=CAM_ASM_000663 /TAXON_ID=267565 /ORGANISM="Skeletonema grethea, Strain CCMP 1804" /LENGTH=491 /DNA_ID=CAMNT_0048179027 /DNA_START=66 /DNA_END=1541 /DNA_ORIENTATION=-